jgi:antitoxin component YwqK of YwqJK toxin-antitoxin module
MLCSIRGARTFIAPGTEREALEALEDGHGLSFSSADWELVSELCEVDFSERDDFDYYIVDRDVPVSFLKGDLALDGNVGVRELIDSIGHSVYLFTHQNEELAIVVLGDLKVSGNLDLDESLMLFVTGSVTAQSVTNGYGTLVVGQDLTSEFVYLDTADEGGIIYASNLETRVFIDAGGKIEDYPSGDYLLLLANGYSPRQKYTLQRALEELGIDVGEFTSYHALKSLGEANSLERIEQLEALVQEYFEARPENLPERAVWNSDFSRYTLHETDEDGQLHGVKADWEADGTPTKRESYHHGTPHGEWLVEFGGRMYPQMFENGKRMPPESVPDDAVWLEDEGEWEHSETDEDGKKHGHVRWWRPDGTMCCESHYEHGVAKGEGRRFHESGEVSQSYKFVAGKLHGERWWHATDNYTTEYKFHPNIAKAVQRMNMGTPLDGGRYFDKDGNEVDFNGNPI